MNDKGEFLISDEANQYLDEMVEIQNNLGVEDLNVLALKLTEQELSAKENDLEQLQMFLKLYAEQKEELKKKSEELKKYVPNNN